MNMQRQYTYLAMAGALPFVAAATLPLAGLSSLPIIGALDDMAASYGLAIASFMAGTHWGLYLASPQRPPMNLFVSSNALTLIAWFAFLLTPLSVAFLAQTLAFAALLIIDLRLQLSGHISPEYCRVRTRVTAVVIVSLVIMLLGRTLT